MSQLKLKGGTSGDVTIKCVDQAGTNTATFPATTGNVVTTGDSLTVSQGMIADQAINEAKLQVSNAPTNGHFLSAQSGNTGGLTWAENDRITKGNTKVQCIDSGTNGTIIFENDTFESMRINENLSVMIGTDEGTVNTSDSGEGRLIVCGTDANADFNDTTNASITISNTDNTTANFSALYFGWEDDDGNPHFASSSITGVHGQRTNGQRPSGALRFSTQEGNANPVSRMLINPAGRIGFYGKGVTEEFTSALNAFEFRLNTGHHSNVGTMMLRSEDGLNADGDQVRFVVTDNNRSAVIGVAKTASNKAGFVNIVTDDGQNGILWVDNNDVLRTSNSTAVVGSTGGTVVGSQSSDSRLKNSITDYTGGLSLVNQLRPVNYKYTKDPDRVHAGFIAQEVQSIIPESVYDTQKKPNVYGEVEQPDGTTRIEVTGIDESADNLLAMEYVEIIPALVNSIKELKAEVDTLKAKVAALEAG